MARPVIADHILFDECIPYFRKDLCEKVQFYQADSPTNKESFSCIATTFEITQAWEFDHFTIFPSNRKMQAVSKDSLFSFVKNPPWINNISLINKCLFGEVLSTLLAFVTLSPVKSLKDNTVFWGEDDLNILENNGIIPRRKADNDIVKHLHLTLPFVSGGPGAWDSRLSNEDENLSKSELESLIKTVENMEENLYVFVLQVMRLIQLSILVKRDDFGLAYLLVVSAIEAVAQKEFKNQKSKKHSKESEWAEKAKTDADFNELLIEYKKLRGKPTLTEQFVNFILKYAPISEWDTILPDPYEKYGLKIEWDDWTQGTQHPSTMQDTDIKQILQTAYKHRSQFVHQGTQPPHKNPCPSLNKFFEKREIFIREEKIDEQSLRHITKIEISPTYDLMLRIAKYSILKWLHKETLK